MSEPSQYVMTISLNVLNHLGINLYSNVPAVLSEVVANAYDADAERVNITIDSSQGTVTIKDDGEGMTLGDVNDRYLNVGYRRRDDNRAVTPRFGRQVMGRKGIGKLSLFSVASSVEVHTAKDGDRNALRMTIDGIRAAIGDELEDPKPYRPDALPPDLVDFDSGTRIILTDLKKGLANVESGLTKRLARRFSILGPKTRFRLFLNGHEISVADRDYFHKLQYVWIFGDEEYTTETAARCTNATQKTTRFGASVGGGSVTGWIGTVANSGSLKEPEGDNINKISLMVRGKLAHEDLLEDLNEGKIFRAYLIGELNADFLDFNEEPDIATSSRQRIVEDDPRYEKLIQWLRNEITGIGSQWTAMRNTEGTKNALVNPLIKEWFQTLQHDSRVKAERLFGKINTLTVDQRERDELFAHSVLAFESLRYRDQLDALDVMEPDEVAAVATLFKTMEQVESALYYQIVVQRLRVIDKLEDHVDENALERVLQEHLYDNMWLLDPSWERATDRSMEERISRAFGQIKNQLTPEEEASRMDIRYKRVTGANVIVELKRAHVITDTYTLMSQVDKYRNALLRYLADTDRDEPVEVVCVVGRDLRDWSNPHGKQESKNAMSSKNIRVVKYEQLLADARAGYRDYLNRREDLGQVRAVLDSLAKDVNPPQGRGRLRRGGNALDDPPCATTCDPQ